jgi:hypothetical protein
MEIFGIKLTLTLAFSIWGAGLSTILGLLKIKEYWSSRFQFDISYVWRGHVDYGNDIIVQNLSGKPILLDYMEIFYFKKTGWFKKEKTILWSPEDESLNIKIDSLSGEKFNFSEANYFVVSGKQIYVRLFFAGKKPIERKVG